ncbi:uncharacterized protein LODBEIA_P52490 [Lodderomyces beijingensis]|uniref:Uncharacterized protein n=1 Tax=Lodderomyces beijingensis TaxID=1775926 RepID=A0ABP0ZWB0_9ASCO
MFFLLIAIAVALTLLMVILPYCSGLTKIKLNSEKKKSSQAKKKKTTAEQIRHQPTAQYGYIPPDELNAHDEKTGTNFKAKASALKEKFDVHAEDLPIRIELNKFGDNDGEMRKRRIQKVDWDTDPDKYDYDLDELIAEENEFAKREQSREFYKDQKFGQEKEEMV